MPTLEFVIFCEKTIRSPFTIINPLRILAYGPEHRNALWTIWAWVRVSGLKPLKAGQVRFEYHDSAGTEVAPSITAPMRAEQDGVADTIVSQDLQGPLPPKIEFRVIVAGEFLGSRVLLTEEGRPPESGDSN